MSALRTAVYATLSGLLFGLGLAISRMTQPEKVLNFLDVAGQWDPSLALVMIGGLAVSTPGFWWVRRRGSTVEGTPLHLPTARAIDAPLLVGAVLFGLGWGLAGYCPGPAVAGIGRLAVESLLFVPAMLVGMWLAKPLQSLGGRT